MKKFAYIIMGEDYTPQKDQALFETKEESTYIFTVKNYEEAKEKAVHCAESGFGIIELCGAFGEERAKEIIELTGGKIGVSFVIHFPEQDGIFEEFFAN